MYNKKKKKILPQSKINMGQLIKIRFIPLFESDRFEFPGSQATPGSKIQGSKPVFWGQGPQIWGPVKPWLGRRNCTTCTQVCIPYCVEMHRRANTNLRQQIQRRHIARHRFYYFDIRNNRSTIHTDVQRYAPSSPRDFQETTTCIPTTSIQKLSVKTCTSHFDYMYIVKLQTTYSHYIIITI